MGQGLGKSQQLMYGLKVGMPTKASRVRRRVAILDVRSLCAAPSGPRPASA